VRGHLAWRIRHSLADLAFVVSSFFLLSLLKKLPTSKAVDLATAPE